MDSAPSTSQRGLSRGSTSSHRDNALRDGVSMLKAIGKCLRRPLRLKKSSQMLQEGHDFERCCDQMLLAPVTFARSGSTVGGATTDGDRSLLRSGDSAGGDGGALFLPASTSSSIGETSGTFSADNVLFANDDSNEGGDDAENLGLFFSEFGRRLKNKAKKVPELSVALQKCNNESAQHAFERSNASVVPAHHSVAHSLPSRDAATVSLERRKQLEADDDVATQMFYTDFTTKDLLKQKELVELEESLIHSLERRFEDDVDGKALLQSRLGNAKILTTSPSSTKKGAAPRFGIEAFLAEGKPLSPSKLNEVGIEISERSPTRALLPPIVASPSHDSCRSEHIPASLDMAPPSPLHTATRLAPLADPVSFDARLLMHHARRLSTALLEGMEAPSPSSPSQKGPPDATNPVRVYRLQSIPRRSTPPPLASVEALRAEEELERMTTEIQKPSWRRGVADRRIEREVSESLHRTLSGSPSLAYKCSVFEEAGSPSSSAIGRMAKQVNFSTASALPEELLESSGCEGLADGVDEEAIHYYAGGEDTASNLDQVWSFEARRAVVEAKREVQQYYAAL